MDPARKPRVLFEKLRFNGRKTANVAAWKVFKHVAPKRLGDDEDQRHAMVQWRQAPAVVEKIQAVDTMGARALMFAVLTATRISEATGVQWGEIDFDKKLWTIPASRMKMRKAHVVPLSRQAIELLEELFKVRTGVEDRILARVRASLAAK